MYDIAVIGAGQLGRRHLQGLAQSKLCANLHVVDPIETSLHAARSCVTGEQEQGPWKKTVRFYTRVEDLPAGLNLVILATTADVRLDVLRTLCRISPPKYLILEKVLFQRLSDYRNAGQLIEDHDVSAWVNCPRRLYPIYDTLRDFFSDDKPRYMGVYGGSWGLGCNSIHFIDLLQFLAGGGELLVTADGLAPGVLSSKRVGFIEFSGTLRGSIGNAEFRLSSVAESSKRHLISLHGSGSKSVFIDEVRGELWRHTGNDATLEHFKLSYQSELSGTLAEGILTKGYCRLSPYAESAALHIPLLKALGRHAGGSAGAEFFCPIT